MNEYGQRENSMRRVLLILALLLIMPSLADAKGRGGGYRYKGGKAIDGDTFRYKGERYRVRQYNAPELGQPGSQKATRRLQNKLDSGDYKWEPIAKDAYGRPIVEEKRD